MSALVVCEGRYWIGHVGDSKVFMLRRGTLRQLTRDHTIVEEMRRLGLVDAGGAGRHRHRHLLTRTVGGDPLLAVDLVRGQCETGDCFILATDGIFEHLTVEDVRDIFTKSAPAEAAAACVAEANRRGGFDNLTVLGVRLTT
jgi:protein phosphatase